MVNRGLSEMDEGALYHGLHRWARMGLLSGAILCSELDSSRSVKIRGEPLICTDLRLSHDEAFTTDYSDGRGWDSFLLQETVQIHTLKRGILAACEILLLR